MDSAQLKGQLPLSRLEYVRAQHGAAAVERVLRALPDEDRARVAALSRDAWCPFGTLMRLDRAIAEALGRGDERIFVELGRASALHRTELLGEHVTLVNVHGYLSRLADEHRRFHTFGRAEYKRLGFRRGQIAYSEYPEVDPAYCLSGIGYLTAAVEQLSGAAARVEEVTCQCNGQRECCFDLRWEER